MMKSLIVSLLLLYGPLATSNLRSDYESSIHLLQNNQFSLPILMESSDRNGLLEAVVMGKVEQPYDVVRGQIRRPEAWCEMMFLHLNTKACVHQTLDGASTVTLYLGEKEYQPLSETKPLNLLFDVKTDTARSQLVELRSKAGPYATTDYLITVDMVPLDECCTIIRFHLSFRTNPMLQSLGDLYLKVFARNKIGFTKVGTNRKGKPIYVRGLQGVLERNTLRNYLAVTTFFDAMDEALERRLELWFEATEKYHQLNELSKSDYLKYKLKEIENQISAQRESARR